MVRRRRSGWFAGCMRSSRSQSGPSRVSNHAWVCFTCRTTTRRPPAARNVRCRLCRAECERLGYKVPIPPRNRIKAWIELRHSYYENRRAVLLRNARTKVRRRHMLEKEILRLEQLPQNAGRNRYISVLKDELAQSGR